MVQGCLRYQIQEFASSFIKIRIDNFEFVCPR